MSSDDSIYISGSEEQSPLMKELVSGSDISGSEVAEPAVAYSSAIKRDTPYLKLVHVAREGLAYTKFKIAEAAFQLSKQELSCLLHISDRTLERIHKDKKRLSTPQTERILELSMLFEVGWDLFGSRDNFRKWLDVPAQSFKGKTPLSMLDTTYGIQSVEQLLQRLSHGVLI